MNVVLRLVKSFSGPPLPGSRYDGPGPASPIQPASALRRDRVADVLQAVEDVLRAVLDAVLVAGDQAAGDPAVEEVLALVVELAGQRVDPLDQLLGDAGVVAEPDRPGDHQDVAGHEAGVDVGPLVGLPPVLAHVGIDPGGDVVVDQPDHLHLDPVLAHDRRAGVDQALGVAGLGTPLEGAVDERRLRPVKSGRRSQVHSRLVVSGAQRARDDESVTSGSAAHVCGRRTAHPVRSPAARVGGAQIGAARTPGFQGCGPPFSPARRYESAQKPEER